MANPEHVELVRKGNSAIRKWRRSYPRVQLDLRDAQFTDANLTDLNLMDANLRNVDLSGADLSRTILWDADLRRASFFAARLRDTHLDRADLRRANLARAILLHATMERAKLADARLGDTVLVGLDLSGTRGLEGVSHVQPSSIDIDTIVRSEGKIPESFLRGCGVPEELIVQIPAIIGSMQPIQFHSCFISHSHRDDEFATRLHGRMRDDRLRVWFAPEDLRGGRKSHEQIDQAIRVYDKLLLVLSEHSMESEWVKSEIRWARKKERETGKRVLFPIRLVGVETIRAWTCFDADGGKDLAVEVREYHIPDFSEWKDHDAFEVEYDKLLRDLKKDE